MAAAVYMMTFQIPMSVYKILVFEYISMATNVIIIQVHEHNIMVNRLLMVLGAVSHHALMRIVTPW